MAEIVGGPIANRSDALSSSFPRPLTTSHEALAYLLANLVRIAGAYVVFLMGFLTPIFLWAYHAGGIGASMLLSFAIGVLWVSFAFALFLPARGLFDGTPTSVAGQGGARAIASNGSEISAYALSHLIGIIASIAFSYELTGPLLASLRRQGHAALGYIVGITFSLVFMILTFVLFIYVRKMFENRTSIATLTSTALALNRPQIASPKNYYMVRFIPYGIIGGVILKEFDTALLFYNVDLKVFGLFCLAILAVIATNWFKFYPIAIYLLLTWRMGIHANFFSIMIASAVVGALFGAPTGVLIGTIVGHFKARSLTRLGVVNTEGFRPYLVGVILPVIFLAIGLPLWIFWLTPKMVEWMS